jgi:hypothetical protein
MSIGWVFGLRFNRGVTHALQIMLRMVLHESASEPWSMLHHDRPQSAHLSWSSFGELWKFIYVIFYLKQKEFWLISIVKRMKHWSRSLWWSTPRAASPLDVLQLWPLSPEVSDILYLLHKGVIYTMGGPSIQTYMTKYIREMIYLMYRAQHMVPPSRWCVYKPYSLQQIFEYSSWREINTRIRHEYAKTNGRKYSFPTSIIREWRVYSPLVKHSGQSRSYQAYQIDHGQHEAFPRVFQSLCNHWTSGAAPTTRWIQGEYYYSFILSELR